MKLQDLVSVRLCVVWVLLLALSGCGTEAKLRGIQIGMTQEKVIQLAGEPKEKLIDQRARLEIWIYPAILGAPVSPQVAFDTTTKLVVSVTLNDDERISAKNQKSDQRQDSKSKIDPPSR